MRIRSEAFSVTRQIPSYLRLHSAETLDTRTRGARPDEDPGEAFWQAFTETTGWMMQPRPRGGAVQLRSAVIGDGVMSAEDLMDVPAVSQAAAVRLATVACELTARLRGAETLLRQQEAKLAVTEVTPVTPDPAHQPHDAGQLADKLETILTTATKAIRCRAAGLYMLDETTSLLKLRACTGLDPARLTDPPRQLRGSLADLEALVGSVVEVDCNDDGNEFVAEERFGSALCLAVNVGDTPVGTLWFWGELGQTFEEAEKSALRLVAPLIAHELTADTYCRRANQATKAIRPLRAATAWQERQQPLPQPLAPGWNVTGWTQTPLALSRSWFHWDVLPDGMLAIVLAEAHATGYDGAMIAATARAAWQAHSGYRHDPAQLLRRISDTLWSTNSGDQIVSMTYAQIDPATGDGEIATAGSISGLIASAYGFRPLIELNDPIGAQIDIKPRNQHFRLERGELMMAYSGGLVQAVGQPGDAAHLTQQRVAQVVRSGDPTDVESVMARLRREAAKTNASKAERTIVALSRQADT